MSIDGFFSRLRKVESTGCWEWPLSVNASGYGQVSVNGKIVRAHRHAYVLAKGPITEGMFVCHSCDNRRCCNPDHLWLGTVLDNNTDAWRKGRRQGNRNFYKRGSQHPSAILSEWQRQVIRDLRKSGASYKAAGAFVGVSDVTASQVCKS